MGWRKLLSIGLVALDRFQPFGGKMESGVSVLCQASQGMAFTDRSTPLEVGIPSSHAIEVAQNRAACDDGREGEIFF